MYYVIAILKAQIIPARSMSFLVQGKDEKWMKSNFNMLIALSRCYELKFSGNVIYI